MISSATENRTGLEESRWCLAGCGWPRWKTTDHFQMTSHTKCHWGSFPNLLKKFQFSLEQFLVAAQVKPALSLATHTHTPKMEPHLGNKNWCKPARSTWLNLCDWTCSWDRPTFGEVESFPRSGIWLETIRSGARPASPARQLATTWGGGSRARLCPVDPKLPAALGSSPTAAHLAPANVPP